MKVEGSEDILSEKIRGCAQYPKPVSSTRANLCSHSLSLYYCVRHQSVRKIPPLPCDSIEGTGTVIRRAGSPNRGHWGQPEICRYQATTVLRLERQRRMWVSPQPITWDLPGMCYPNCQRHTRSRTQRGGLPSCHRLVLLQWLKVISS